MSDLSNLIFVCQREALEIERRTKPGAIEIDHIHSELQIGNRDFPFTHKHPLLLAAAGSPYWLEDNAALFLMLTYKVFHCTANASRHVQSRRVGPLRSIPLSCDPHLPGLSQFVMNAALEALLRPRSIAILGASADFQKLNGRTLKALIDKGYAGQLYPVNPKYREIAGLRCYADVTELPDAIDLAIVAVPARHVPSTLRGLGRRRVAAAIVFSSGFAEVGGAGVKLEEELKAAIAQSGVRVLGPNCLGLLNAFENVIATFSQFSLGPTPPGPAAFVTQSGALGTATAGSARQRGLNFGYFINTGNETDVTFVDVMSAVIRDPHIRVGAGYIEGLKDGRGLMEIAAVALELAKPLVLMKVGQTRAGARAIASHTGSLAGEDAVFDGVIRERAIIRARSDEQLLDIADIAANCALPQGNGIGFITRSGGAGALMADRAEELGLNVTTLSEDTVAKLNQVVPAFGSTTNPVDITAQGLVDPAIMRESLKILLSDPGIDIAAVWLAFTEKHADITVQTFVEAKAQTDKPFVVSWVGIPDAALAKMREHGITVLRGAEPAVDAVAALVRYAEGRRAWLADRIARDSAQLPEVIFPASGGPVPSMTARALLDRAGVATVLAELVTTEDGAVAAADILGYPVALKIESPERPAQDGGRRRPACLAGRGGGAVGLSRGDRKRASTQTGRPNRRCARAAHGRR